MVGGPKVSGDFAPTSKAETGPQVAKKISRKLKIETGTLASNGLR